ncbi:rhythmically expressed gene 5 protein [Diachasma alloeum]|uniref:rhythmically expressed gene 5 protein n=1 Tax=Diachasma alloeum TaxID=454923 RepID=UPI0007381588|nr:rhythmically expressed gene 5 protein [Diachasma alloeum]
MKRQIEMIAILALATIWAVRVDSSAIPMWEFLSRDEKISHLYRLFSRRVVSYCQDSSMPDCNKNILVTGLRQLANMDDNEMDRLDPYQRDADDMIWRTVMGDNGIASTVHQEKQDNYYTTDNDPLVASGSDHNCLGDESVRSNDYARPSDSAGPYLVGPMVIRVFPDGRPVPEDQNLPLPRDEDLEEFKYPRVPSVPEIEGRTDRQILKKPYGLLKRNSVVKAGQWGIFSPQNNYYRGNPLFRARRMPETVNTRIFRYSE